MKKIQNFLSKFNINAKVLRTIDILAERGWINYNIVKLLKLIYAFQILLLVCNLDLKLRIIFTIIMFFIAVKFKKLYINLYETKFNFIVNIILNLAVLIKMYYCIKTIIKVYKIMKVLIRLYEIINFIVVYIIL